MRGFMKLKRYSLAEREKYVELVYDKIESGHSLRSAVKEVGINIASFYRWEEEIKGAKHRSAKFGESRLPTVDEAIATLVHYQNHGYIDRLVAICRLRAWMLWPTEPEVHEPAVVACLLAYAAKDPSVRYLKDIQSGLLAALAGYMRIDAIMAFYDWSANIGPRFEELRQYSSRYSDRDAMAEVVRYFLFTAISGNKYHVKPSLNKAFYVIQAGYVDSNLQISERVFDGYWKKYAPSAPFIYVSNYATNLSWELDPTASSYLECVDELMSKREDVRLYLARCKFVTEIMRANLDRRALDRVRYPVFPEELDATPIVPEPIKALQIG